MNHLQRQIRDFADERSWAKFHSPKNLAVSISIEAAELLETFQWAPDTDAITVAHEARLREEIADVFIYLLRLCDVTGIDLVEATEDKLRVNAEKYPVNLSRGVSTKYTEFLD